MPITVLAPSRGRPQRAYEMAESFMATKRLPGTELVVVIDDNDSTRDDYFRIHRDLEAVSVIVLLKDQTGDLVKATNSAWAMGWRDGIIGNVGDDHKFVSEGWDVDIEEALDEPGVAYGNDLFQGENLPTAVFISNKVSDALGWYALPTMHHLYIDQVWKKIGEEMGSLHYLPEVIIEHLHPAAGKSEWDASYTMNNSDAMYAHDSMAFEKWLKEDMESDIGKIKAALRVPA